MAAELSAGQARQVKAEEKRQKAKDAERKAMGSYMQVGFRSHDQTALPGHAQCQTACEACKQRSALHAALAEMSAIFVWQSRGCPGVSFCKGSACPYRTGPRL